jgi:hypothetical protein
VGSYSGWEYEIHFEGVQRVEMFAPEGMELRRSPKCVFSNLLRRFRFANNSEEDRKSLKSDILLCHKTDVPGVIQVYSYGDGGYLG